VHSLEHHRPALLESALDRRPNADEDVARLLEEPGDDRILGLLGLAEPGRRFEAGVVDRRHELLREERAHRLADEVGGRDPGDPKPVGRLCCNRRLARSGRAPDEHDHRQVELLQLTQLAEPARRLGALGLAQDLDRQLAHALELDALLVTLGEILLDSLRQLVGTADRDTDGDEGASHQPFRVRVVRRAERQRFRMAGMTHGQLRT
jgi:hypothetical protein